MSHPVFSLASKSGGGRGPKLAKFSAPSAPNAKKPQNPIMTIWGGQAPPNGGTSENTVLGFLEALEIDQLNEIADYTKIKGSRVEKLYLDIARLSRIFGAERTTGYPVNQKNLNILKIMKTKYY